MSPRFLDNMWTKSFSIVAVAMSIYEIMYAMQFSFMMVEDISHRAIFMAFVFFLGFISLTKKWGETLQNDVLMTILRILLILLGVVVSLYIAVIYELFPSYTASPDFYPNNLEIIMGIMLIFLVLLLTREAMGWALPIICVVFFLSTMFCNYLPGSFAGPGYSLSRVVNSMYLWSTGVFGIAIGVASTYVFLFVLFATFFAQSGAGKFVTDLAVALLGNIRGGPAKVSIVASGFFGTLSGSAVANIMTTGSFSIPLMQKIGYKKDFAAAVEAVASTGGMMMPPVMGAAAFVMAEFLEVPFATILMAATIPAILFYFALFIAVDLEAATTGIKGVSVKGNRRRKEIIRVLKEGWFLLIPLGLLIYLLVWTHLSPMLDAVLGILCILVVTAFKKETRFGIRKFVNTLEAGAKNALSASVACAAVGIIIGSVEMSGLGINLSDFLISLSKGSLPLLLVVTMIASLILGLGMIPTVVYITLAILIAPALVDAGVPRLSAHFFVFFFGIIAMITPPVAISSYAAASLAGSNPVKTSLISFRLGLTAFILPFMFAYDQALLMVGSMSSVLIASFSAAIGVSILNMSIQGYGYVVGKLNILFRIMMLLAAISLIKPGVTTDLIGLCIVLFVFIGSGGIRKMMPARH